MSDMTAYLPRDGDSRRAAAAAERDQSKADELRLDAEEEALHALTAPPVDDTPRLVVVYDEHEIE